MAFQITDRSDGIRLDGIKPDSISRIKISKDRNHYHPSTHHNTSIYHKKRLSFISSSRSEGEPVKPSKPWWLSGITLFGTFSSQSNRSSKHRTGRGSSVIVTPQLSGSADATPEIGGSDSKIGSDFEFGSDSKIGVQISMMDTSFSPVEYIESFFHSFTQPSPNMSTRESLTAETEETSQLASINLQRSFRDEQLTSAHLEESGSIINISSQYSNQSSVVSYTPPQIPPSIHRSNTTRHHTHPDDPLRRCSVAFFDLDDTLIPTDWVRRAFVAARNVQTRQGRANMDFEYPAFPCPSVDSSPVPAETVTIFEALSPHIQAAVRRHLEALGGDDFDERAADLIGKACRAFGVVVVVTNARSVAWLKIVSDLFPKLKAKLRELNVPIIRAVVPGAAAHQTDFASIGEYFQYWTDLKRLQFSRVAAATQKVISALQRTAGEASRHFLSDLIPSWFPLGQSGEVDMFEFRVPSDVQSGVRYDSRLGRTLSTPTSSALARLSGGELLLSPRSHGKESHELEAILQQNEAYMTPMDDDLLSRIVAHQVRRFLLHHHSKSNTEIADLPYSPRSVLSGPLPTFPPSTPCYSRHTIGTTTGLPPLRPQGQQLPDFPHLPELLRWEVFSRRTEQIGSAIPNTDPNTTLDIICIGDSEFELCAARELASTTPQLFRGVGLVKCRPGLPPDAFRDQLDEIEAAMAILSVERQDRRSVKSGVKHLGPFVSTEFVTRACGFQTESLGLSLVEREALRFRRPDAKVTAQSLTFSNHIAASLAQRISSTGTRPGSTSFRPGSSASRPGSTSSLKDKRSLGSSG